MSPVRTCIGCRRRAGVDELVRITRAPGGIAVDGPSDGRGAWLCRDRGGQGMGVDGDCLAAALGRRAFERAWRGPLDDDERRALARLVGDPAERPDAP